MHTPQIEQLNVPCASNIKVKQTNKALHRKDHNVAADRFPISSSEDQSLGYEWLSLGRKAAAAQAELAERGTQLPDAGRVQFL